MESWWVGQRASDALLLGSELSRSLTLQADAGARDGSMFHVLEGVLGERKPWDSSQLESGLKQLLNRTPDAFTTDDLHQLVIVPYRPSQLVTASLGGAKVYANDVALFDLLDSNISGVEKLAGAGFANYRHTVVRASELRFDKLVGQLGLPFVVKGAISCAGNQCHLIAAHDDLIRARVALEDRDVLASEFLSGATYNIHGIVAATGVTVALPPSLQLVGLRELTTNPLGYCGNIFHPIALSGAQSLDRVARRLGSWLHDQGYRGIFGADVVNGESEWQVVDLNPRFQASTLLLAMAGAAGALAGAHCTAFSEREVVAPVTPDAESAFGLDSGEAIVQTAMTVGSAARAVARVGLVDGVYSYSRKGDLSLHEARVRLPQGGEVVVLDAPKEGMPVLPGATLCRCWTRWRDAGVHLKAAWIGELRGAVTAAAKLQ